MAKKKETEEQDVFSYDKAISEVEEILQKLQKPEDVASMDELLSDVTKATKLLTDCEAYLSQTQQKIREALDNDK